MERKCLFWKSCCDEFQSKFLESNFNLIFLESFTIRFWSSRSDHEKRYFQKLGFSSSPWLLPRVHFTRESVPFRQNKARNGTGAKGGLFQTLNDKSSQLFSQLTSFAHWGCFVEVWTRLTSPILTVLLVIAMINSHRALAIWSPITAKSANGVARVANGVARISPRRSGHPAWAGFGTKNSFCFSPFLLSLHGNDAFWKYMFHVCSVNVGGHFWIGCNNGIGGFHKNLATFREPKLPDFLLT